MLTQLFLLADEVTVNLPGDLAVSGQPSAYEITLLLTIFLLAVFVGFEIITKVPPTLHTPLMSGSNAISGITLVGALLVVEMGSGWFAQTLGFLAVVLATINAVGGFLVTHRMLEMFRKKKG
ncbi:MAG: NAD(P) transhydrogenase subunit alpha [Planctomyces sp.]|nr:NAD(P) transhydrogenase subunit alpha [Planctomyces sp.]